MRLVDRARNIILIPKTEWAAIAAESTPIPQVVAGYVVPLSAIAALAWFVGVCLVGVSTAFTGTMRVGIVWGLVAAILHIVMAVVMVYVLAFIIDALAPSLRAAAELRLRHPSLSLRELAARADPPVTKAAMAGRLARLVALARDDVEAPEATG